VTGIEVGNDFGGAMENFGALNTGLSDRDFAVGAASVKSETNLISVIIPIKGIFHLVAVVIIVMVGEDSGGRNRNLMLAEKFDH